MEVEIKMGSGKEEWWVFAYALSLDCLSSCLHLVTPFPIFGSQLKCHFSNVVLFPNSSKQTSIFSICSLGVLYFSLFLVSHCKSGP